VDSIVFAIVIVLVMAGGIAIGFFIAKSLSSRKLQEAKKEVERRKQDAEARIGSVEKESDLKLRDEQLKMKSAFDKEMEAMRVARKHQENRLRHRNETLEKKADLLDKMEVEVTGRERTQIVREKALVQQEKKYQALVDDWKAKVERASGLTAQEAKKQLVESLISEAKHESAKMIRIIEEETRETAEKSAKKIIALASQRVAVEYINEKSVSVVHLPSEDMKGRIIGREGRNIRALEASTGIDFIVDDTPEAVILSGHNPIRREIARQTLVALIQDGRIHPGRIEEIAKKCEAEVEKEIVQAGEQATFDVGVHGIHPELVKLIGRLKFRTSYSQNQLNHVIEVAFIAGIMAAELGLNIKMAKRAGLMHDIGKAVDHDVEGSHAIIGMELARKYNEHPDVVVTSSA